MPSEGAQAARSTRPMLPSAGKCIQTKSASDEAGQRGEERNAARVPAGEERDGRANKRQHGEERQDRKSGRKYVHGRLLQIRIAASATTATARMRR